MASTTASSSAAAATAAAADDVVLAMLAEDDAGRSDVFTSYATAPTMYAPRLASGPSALPLSPGELGSLLATQAASLRSLEAWKNRDRTRTSAVGLIACLNIGTEPPGDAAPRVPPFAREECWIDPTSMAPRAALDAIGTALHGQYDRWQPRAKYKLSLDPTVDDVRKLAVSLRKYARDDRVLLHFNGHGVPLPTPGGEVWVFNTKYTQYMPVGMGDLQAWLGSPSLFVFDCSGAGLLVPFFAAAAASSGGNGGALGSPTIHTTAGTATQLPSAGPGRPALPSPLGGATPVAGGAGGGGGGPLSTPLPTGAAASRAGVVESPSLFIAGDSGAARSPTSLAGGGGGGGGHGGSIAGASSFVAGGGGGPPAKDFIVLAACGPRETLPIAPDLPADMFTGWCAETLRDWLLDEGREWDGV